MGRVGAGTVASLFMQADSGERSEENERSSARLRLVKPIGVPLAGTLLSILCLVLSERWIAGSQLRPR